MLYLLFFDALLENGKLEYAVGLAIGQSLLWALRSIVDKQEIYDQSITNS